MPPIIKSNNSIQKLPNQVFGIAQPPLLINLPSERKLTLIYLDGTHTVDHLKSLSLPSAQAPRGISDLHSLFKNEKLKTRPFLVDAQERFLLFGAVFTAQLYSKVYIAVVQYLAALSQIKPHPPRQPPQSSQLPKSIQYHHTIFQTTHDDDLVFVQLL